VGDVPVVGPVWMMGHGGMNNKGVAYVHHGGETKMIEPKDAWEYGIGKGASIFHMLRFAKSAREAREMEPTFSIGDIGRPTSTPCGFYADSTYGYVMESRKDPVIIREVSVMGETDFLYSANSAIHPDAGKAGAHRHTCAPAFPPAVPPGTHRSTTRGAIGAHESDGDGALR